MVANVYLNPNATHELYEALLQAVGALHYLDSFAKLSDYTKSRCDLAAAKAQAYAAIDRAKTKPAPPPGHHEQYLSLVVAHHQLKPPPKTIEMKPHRKTAFKKLPKQRRIA